MSDVIVKVNLEELNAYVLAVANNVRLTRPEWAPLDAAQERLQRHIAEMNADQMEEQEDGTEPDEEAGQS